jgi:hypothetical protein
MPFIHSIVARVFLAAASVVFFAASASVAPARAADVKLETESYTIPSGDPGIDLYIRHKHPAGVETFTPDKILLYVHGATYPSETAFDLPIEGVSMMDLRDGVANVARLRPPGRLTPHPMPCHDATRASAPKIVNGHRSRVGD